MGDGDGVGDGEGDRDGDTVSLGEGDPLGVGLGLADSDGLGDPLGDWLGEGLVDGGGDSDEGEADCAVGGIGGGGGVGGAWENSRMAIRTAMAPRRNINSQDARMDNRPPLSRRPGQGSGHTRVKPGATRSAQWRR